MRAKFIKLLNSINEIQNNFTRGGNPYKKMGVGNNRPLEVLVNERIKEVKSQKESILYQEIRDHLVEGVFTDMDPDDILSTIETVLRNTPIEYQIAWWVDWHPEPDKEKA